MPPLLGWGLFVRAFGYLIRGLVELTFIDVVALDITIIGLVGTVTLAEIGLGLWQLLRGLRGTKGQPDLTPKANEVLIRVYATTASAGDWRARGLTVLAGLGFGAYAEYITMPANGKIAHKPVALSFEDAAAIAFGGTTTYDFLVNKGKLRAGERVLINGAPGSVGSASMQSAKHFGAEITGACSAADADLVRAIGADHVIDYSTSAFTQDSPQYDIAVDTLETAP